MKKAAAWRPFSFWNGFRCALRLGCPPAADNSTLAPRKVFFPPRMSPEKTILISSRRARRELCEAFSFPLGTSVL